MRSGTRGAHRRTRAWRTDQRIGGGFSGGSARDASGADGEPSTPSDGADGRAGSGTFDEATAASVHDARQSFIESAPSGQQGHSSCVVELVLADVVCANAMAGTANRS